MDQIISTIEELRASAWIPKGREYLSLDSHNRIIEGIFKELEELTHNACDYADANEQVISVSLIEEIKKKFLGDKGWEKQVNA